MVRIGGFQPQDRGSTPRVGIFSLFFIQFFFPDGLIENGMRIKKLLKNLIIFIKTLKFPFFLTEHFSDKLNYQNSINLFIFV